MMQIKTKDEVAQMQKPDRPINRAIELGLQAVEQTKLSETSNIYMENKAEVMMLLPWNKSIQSNAQ